MERYQVRVIEYDSAWVDAYEREAKVLKDVFGGHLVYLHHVGSTAVPGLVAKPVIDMIPVVDDIQALDAMTPQFAAWGYEGLGEFGLPGRRYFRKGGNHRTHQMHCYEVGSAEIARHLAFRDYLRANGDERERYGVLKKELAQKFPEDMDQYMQGKHDYIQESQVRALAWWARVPLIFITGPVGVGKTTVADALSMRLARERVAHWLMDLDRLTDFYPKAIGDPYGVGVAGQGLKALWTVMRSMGARLVIVPRVLESPHEVQHLAASIHGAEPWVVRLTATLPTLDDRLSQRESKENISWYHRRVRELVPLMETVALGDQVISTEEITPVAIAEAIFEALRHRLIGTR